LFIVMRPPATIDPVVSMRLVVSVSEITSFARIRLQLSSMGDAALGKATDLMKDKAAEEKADPDDPDVNAPGPDTPEYVLL
jgi:hypothetical protein